MRTASVTRNTLETQITVTLNLDGTGRSHFDTGVPFLDHMMDQIARHGLIDLDIVAKGDLHIDAHHTVEDIGITLGQAFAKAIGDKKGIRRYGHAYVPLDEALSRVVIDLSGRPAWCTTWTTPAPASASSMSTCSPSSSMASSTTAW
jgi:imidazoleglycerol-phosphate dehydratase